MSRPGAEDRERPLAVVFLDGEYGDPAWYRALAASSDILLAADGGAAFLARVGLVPQAVVGDFDSLDESIAGALAEQGVEFVRHPVRKDVTDGELAVEEALRRGAGELLLAGATGALDHTLGHLAILRRLAARAIAARLVAPDLAVTVLVAPAEVVLAAPAGVRVSLAPAGSDATVTLEGFDYPLACGTLPADACLGLGNHVLAGGEARIRVHDGAVVALVEWGEEPFAAAGPREEE
jgi:thiamine pyrophosphokinase